MPYTDTTVCGRRTTLWYTCFPTAGRRCDTYVLVQAAWAVHGRSLQPFLHCKRGGCSCVYACMYVRKHVSLHICMFGREEDKESGLTVEKTKLCYVWCMLSCMQMWSKAISNCIMLYFLTLYFYCLVFIVFSYVSSNYFLLHCIVLSSTFSSYIILHSTML